LGRGLGALFPSAHAGDAGSTPTLPDSPADAEDDVMTSADAPPNDLGLVIQDVIYAGLDALLAAMPLELCAYLHLTEGAGPQLYLRTPDLSSMDANECFALFGALRDALDANDPEDSPLEVRGFHAIAMNSPGARSRGLHVVGRRSGALDDPERNLAGRLSRAMAAATHSLEALGPPSEEPTLRLSVEVVEGGPQADISVEAGGHTRTGRGSAESPFEAVALAVLNAFTEDFELAHAGLQEAGAERVALVIVQGSNGARSLGSALGQDPLQATAAAALEAVRRLRDAADRADRERRMRPDANPA
jgi:hypothetical protein